MTVLLLLSSSTLSRAGETTDPHAAPELTGTPVTDTVERTAEGGISLRAPRDWEKVKSSNDAVKIALSAGKGSALNLVAVPAGQDETLQRILTDLPDQLASKFKEFKLIKADFVKLKGQPAARLVYTAKFGKVTLKLCQFYVLKGDTDYVLTASATPANFDALLPQFEAAAVSMKLP